MKTIYKSIALEAASLSVTLALQAEIQSEGETVTADVQASSLDRLRVTLVSPNVSGARDLVASGNATIEGNEIAVSLENLAFGTHRLVVSARFGTQIRTLYALDISVPQAELPNETQEYEDEAIVVSTYGDGGGGGEFPTDYAKQGDDPTATLTDTQAYAQAAAEDAAAAKVAAQALSPFALAADAYNTGKVELAANITAKGVEASASETLPQLASKVSQISQYSYQLDGAEVYKETIYSENLHDLIKIATDIRSRGDLAEYHGIIVARFYKGYETTSLNGASAYICSDNPSVLEIESGVTHVWNDFEDGYADRYIVYLYRYENYTASFTTSGLCPRDIVLLGKCALLQIDYNRLCQLYAPNIGDIETSIAQISIGANTPQGNWGAIQVIDNLETWTTGDLFTNAAGIVFIIMPKLGTISGGHLIVSNSAENNVQYIYMPSLKNISSNLLYQYGNGGECFNKLVFIDMPELLTTSSALYNCQSIASGTANMLNALKFISAPKLQRCTANLIGRIYKGNMPSLEKIYIPSCHEISGFVEMINTGQKAFPVLIDVEVGELTSNLYFAAWQPNSIISDPSKLAQLINNIKNHILAKVSDATGGTQLVFTVSTNMYNAIASETITWNDQTMTLADAFLTKNWLLAGA